MENKQKEASNTKALNDAYDIVIISPGLSSIISSSEDDDCCDGDIVKSRNSEKSSPNQDQNVNFFSSYAADIEEFKDEPPPQSSAYDTKENFFELSSHDKDDLQATATLKKKNCNVDEVITSPLKGEYQCRTSEVPSSKTLLLQQDCYDYNNDNDHHHSYMIKIANKQKSIEFSTANEKEQVNHDQVDIKTNSTQQDGHFKLLQNTEDQKHFSGQAVEIKKTEPNSNRILNYSSSCESITEGTSSEEESDRDIQLKALSIVDDQLPSLKEQQAVTTAPLRNCGPAQFVEKSADAGAGVMTLRSLNLISCYGTQVKKRNAKLQFMVSNDQIKSVVKANQQPLREKTLNYSKTQKNLQSKDDQRDVKEKRSSKENVSHSNFSIKQKKQIRHRETKKLYQQQTITNRTSSKSSSFKSSYDHLASGKDNEKNMNLNLNSMKNVALKAKNVYDIIYITDQKNKKQYLSQVKLLQNEISTASANNISNMIPASRSDERLNQQKQNSSFNQNMAESKQNNHAQSSYTLSRILYGQPCVKIEGQQIQQKINNQSTTTKKRKTPRKQQTSFPDKLPQLQTDPVQVFDSGIVNLNLPNSQRSAQNITFPKTVSLLSPQMQNSKSFGLIQEILVKSPTTNTRGAGHSYILKQHPSLQSPNTTSENHNDLTSIENKKLSKPEGNLYHKFMKSQRLYLQKMNVPHNKQHIRLAANSSSVAQCTTSGGTTQGTFGQRKKLLFKTENSLQEKQNGSGRNHNQLSPQSIIDYGGQQTAALPQEKEKVGNYLSFQDPQKKILQATTSDLSIEIFNNTHQAQTSSENQNKAKTQEQTMKIQVNKKSKIAQLSNEISARLQKSSTNCFSGFSELNLPQTLNKRASQQIVKRNSNYTTGFGGNTTHKNSSTTKCSQSNTPSMQSDLKTKLNRKKPHSSSFTQLVAPQQSQQHQSSTCIQKQTSQSQRKFKPYSTNRGSLKILKLSKKENDSEAMHQHHNLMPPVVASATSKQQKKLRQMKLEPLGVKKQKSGQKNYKSSLFQDITVDGTKKRTAIVNSNANLVKDNTASIPNTKRHSLITTIHKKHPGFSGTSSKPPISPRNESNQKEYGESASKIVKFCTQNSFSHNSGSQSEETNSQQQQEQHYAIDIQTNKYEHQLQIKKDVKLKYTATAAKSDLEDFSISPQRIQKQKKKNQEPKIKKVLPKYQINYSEISPKTISPQRVPILAHRSYNNTITTNATSIQDQVNRLHQNQGSSARRMLGQQQQNSLSDSKPLGQQQTEAKQQVDENCSRTSAGASQQVIQIRQLLEGCVKDNQCAPDDSLRQIEHKNEQLKLQLGTIVDTVEYKLTSLGIDMQSFLNPKTTVQSQNPHNSRYQSLPIVEDQNNIELSHTSLQQKIQADRTAQTLNEKNNTSSLDLTMLSATITQKQINEGNTQKFKNKVFEELQLSEKVEKLRKRLCNHKNYNEAQNMQNELTVLQKKLKNLQLTYKETKYFDRKKNRSLKKVVSSVKRKKNRKAIAEQNLSAIEKQVFAKETSLSKLNVEKKKMDTQVIKLSEQVQRFTEKIRQKAEREDPEVFEYVLGSLNQVVQLESQLQNQKRAEMHHSQYHAQLKDKSERELKHIEKIVLKNMIQNLRHAKKQESITKHITNGLRNNDAFYLPSSSSKLSSYNDDRGQLQPEEHKKVYSQQTSMINTLYNHQDWNLANSDNETNSEENKEIQRNQNNNSHYKSGGNYTNSEQEYTISSDSEVNDHDILSAQNFKNNTKSLEPAMIINCSGETLPLADEEKLQQFGTKQSFLQQNEKLLQL